MDIGLKKIETPFEGINHKDVSLDDLETMCRKIADPLGVGLNQRRRTLYKTLVIHFGIRLGFSRSDIVGMVGNWRKGVYHDEMLDSLKNYGYVNEALAFEVVEAFLFE